jgi:thymidylate synthase
MITTVYATDVNDAFLKLCREAQSWPKEVRRGNEVMLDSPGPVCVEIADPRKRVLNIVGRNNSLPAACAETLWVLAGRDDIEFLKFYLPRAPDFSDDGEIWRAAYGPRLRGRGYFRNVHTGRRIFRIDQLGKVVAHLKAHPNSRRAVMGFLEPVFDLENDYSKDVIGSNMDSKDFPCNLVLSFMVRDGRLDLVVFCRSQDLVWGASGINWFEFTVMQELVAGMIGVPIGTYYHVTNNLHVYSRHFKMVEKVATGMMNSCSEYQAPDYRSIPDVLSMDALLGRFFLIEYGIRSSAPTDYFAQQVLDDSRDLSLIHDLAQVSLAYCAFKMKNFVLSEFFRGGISDQAMLASYDRYMDWQRRNDASGDIR